MSPTIRHKCKYFHSAAQRAKDRRQKFHFCRLQLHVRPRNGKLNLSIFLIYLARALAILCKLVAQALVDAGNSPLSWTLH